MYAEERQQAIAGLVSTHGRVSVNELAATFGVTTETVRRDLATLDRAGVLRRVHGGAVPAALADAHRARRSRTRRHPRRPEGPRSPRPRSSSSRPSAAASLLDAGTTTGRLAALLPPDRELTVVTNSVPIAARARRPCRGIACSLLGGRVRGTHAGRRRRPAPSRASTGCGSTSRSSAPTPSASDTDCPPPTADEAAVKRAMVARRQPCRGAGRFVEDRPRAPGELRPIDPVDVLVTDSDIADADRRRSATKESRW